MFNWINNLKWHFGFMEAGNFYTESLVDFYNTICVYLVVICFLIGYWMFFILNNHTLKKNILLNNLNLNYILSNNIFLKYFNNTNLNDREFTYISIYDIKDYPLLEGTWCVIPLGFISLVAYPSISLEYGTSPDITPLISVKIIAHQWYWVIDLEAKVSPGLVEGYGVDDNNYFFLRSDLFKLYVDTYGNSLNFFEKFDKLDYQVLKQTVELNLKNEDPNFFRLLAVDNKILLPVNTPVKLIITSADVLHSFALPSLGIKIDAIPGRISEQVVVIERPGLFWGQCSELCGPYHGFMPVVFEVTSYPLFLKYLLG